MPDAPVFRHIPGRRAILCVAAFYERTWENMGGYGNALPPMQAILCVGGGCRLILWAGCTQCIACRLVTPERNGSSASTGCGGLGPPSHTFPYFPILSHTFPYTPIPSHIYRAVRRCSPCDTIPYAILHRAKVMPAPIINTGEYRFSGGEL